MLTAIQPDWQDGLAADPDHRAWADARAAEDQRAFDDWMDSAEGQAWPNAKIRNKNKRRAHGRPEKDADRPEKDRGRRRVRRAWGVTS